MTHLRRPILLAALSSLLLASSQAQTSAPTKVSELRDDTAKLQAELVDLDVSLAMLGRTNAWPAPDPVLSPEDWQQAVAAAPSVSVSKWLQEHPSLGLRITRSNTLGPILKGPEDWFQAVVPAVRNAGLSIDMNSDVQLDLSVKLGGGEVTTKEGGRKVGTYNVYSLRMDCSLTVPARVLRGDRVFHSKLEFVASTVVQVRGGLPSARELVDGIRQCVSDTLKKAQADDKSRAFSSPWARWVNGAAGVQERQAAFSMSHRDAEEDLSAGLEYAGGFSGVEGDYASPSKIFVMSDYARVGALGDYWRRWLPHNGISCAVFPAPTLKHTWIVVPDGSGSAVASASRITVRDNDCLVIADGQFARMRGFTHVDRSLTSIAVEGDLRGPLVEQLKEQFYHVRSVAKPKGGRPRHIRHSRADSVKRSLLQRKRIEVPDWAIDQLANRIAFEVESDQDISTRDYKHWMRTEKGKPVFDIAQFGDSSDGGLIPERLQKAVHRSTQRIQLGDPLCVFAFDNIFSTNREGDFVVLADDYLKHFEKTRPSGNGSLYVERVVSGREAARRLIRLYAKDEPAAEAAIRPYQKIFETYKVLSCSYYDEQDPIKNSGRGYWFWYKEAPPNWKKILDAAPRGCGLHRIGPPVSLAPDYMKEAKEELAKYRAANGH